MDEIPRPQPITKTAGQLFYNLCIVYQLDFQAMQEIADAAQVHKSIVGQMFVGIAIRRIDAEKVLAAFSTRTGRTWSLDNVKMALLPTFNALHHLYQFDPSLLATGAGVEEQVIERMLKGKPVHQQEAHLVLQVASRIAGERFTLETVDVPVINEEVQ